MDPTPIPTEEVWPNCERFVAMPPDGDMLNEEIRPAEMLRGLDGSLPFVACRLMPNERELEQLKNGEPLWLIMFVPGPIPFAVEHVSVLFAEEDHYGHNPAGEG